jgi:hypothetical protein
LRRTKNTFPDSTLSWVGDLVRSAIKTNPD